MASRWLRFLHRGSVTTQYCYKKIVALFLAKCMDFTVQADVATGGSWVSTEKNGSTGAFSGSDWNFTDSSAPFTKSDYGKYLIVKDNTNPANAGIYYIRKFNSTTSIEIDFFTAPDEFPASSTGLSWWIVGKDYQLPSDPTDYCRLKSRHSTQWAIELTGLSAHTGSLIINVSVDGTWETSGRILGTDAGAGDEGPGLDVSTGFGDDCVIIVEGDYDGEWLHLIDHTIADGSSHLLARPCGVLIARLDNVIEAGKTDHEKIVLAGGNTAGGINYRWWQSSYASDDLGYCRYWHEDTSQQKIGYMITLSYFGSAQCYVIDNLPWYSEATPEFNRRIGTPEIAKMPLYDGTYVLADPHNNDNLYHFLGRLKGHYRTTRFPNDPTQLSASGPPYRYMTPLNLNGTRDTLIVADGFVINWNGYTNGGY